VEDQIVWVRVDRIVADERRAEPADWLVDVLQDEGLIEPVFLRELGDGWYQLVAGWDSLEVARQVRRETIKSMLLPSSPGDLTADEQTLFIFRQRECLEPLHRARLLQRVLDSGRYKHAKLATKLGMWPGNLSHMLKPLRFPEVVAAVAHEGLQYGNAKQLAALPDGPRAALLEELRLAKGDGPNFPTVREVAERVEQLKPRKKRAEPPVLPAELFALLVAQGGVTGVAKGPKGQAPGTVLVSPEDWERVAEMIRQHGAESGSPAPAGGLTG
jgi:ParB-like chromosome segregation protein Spo0J